VSGGPALSESVHFGSYPPPGSGEIYSDKVRHSAFTTHFVSHCRLSTLAQRR